MKKMSERSEIVVSSAVMYAFSFLVLPLSIWAFLLLFTFTTAVVLAVIVSGLLLDRSMAEIGKKILEGVSKEDREKIRDALARSKGGM